MASASIKYRIFLDQPGDCQLLKNDYALHAYWFRSSVNDNDPYVYTLSVCIQSVPKMYIYFLNGYNSHINRDIIIQDDQ
jgi:hypothetical protein